MDGLNWRKATYSGSGGGSCVEVASDVAILVRDTTDRDGGTLAFTSEAWTTFLADIRLARRRKTPRF